MPKTAKDLTQEEMARYKESYRQRKIQLNLIINKRYEDAWKIAQEAAQVLYTIFQAKKVKVFGSLINRSRFINGPILTLPYGEYQMKSICGLTGQ